MDLRYFLAVSMMLSGAMSVLFGLAFYVDIHSFAYFVVMQVIAGIFQSAGFKVFTIFVSFFKLFRLRLARCCDGGCQLVWQRKEGLCHGSLEFQYSCWKHSWISDGW